MRILSIFVLSVCALSAHAAEPATAAAVQAPARAKLICKLEKPTGSQMVKRVCMTQEQADHLRELAQRELDQQSMQMRR